MNHVFVDLENVPQVDLAGFGDRVVKLTLFLGDKQKRLDAELVQQLLDHAAHVHLVRLTSSGRNALDFTLTYYLGRAVAGDPTGFFHVVSKDKGFDPLIAHLRHHHVNAARHDAFSGVMAQINPSSASSPIREPRRVISARAAVAPATGTDSTPPSDIPLTEVLAHLSRNRSHQPKRRAKLRAVLKNKFHWDDDRSEQVIDQLIAAGHVGDDKGTLTYAADSA